MNQDNTPSLTSVISSQTTKDLWAELKIVMIAGCTKYAQYVILLTGTNPGQDRNSFTQPVANNKIRPTEIKTQKV